MVDWISNPPSMDSLTDVISTALHKIDITLSAIAYREYGVGESAGFYIIDNAS